MHHDPAIRPGDLAPPIAPPARSGHRAILGGFRPQRLASRAVVGLATLLLVGVAAFAARGNVWRLGPDVVGRSPATKQ